MFLLSSQTFFKINYSIMGCRIKYIMSQKIACAGRLYSWYKDTTKYRKPFSYQESSRFHKARVQLETPGTSFYSLQCSITQGNETQLFLRSC